MSDIFPVIMAGGSGTRFWPLSRVAKPKQFLPLTSSRPLITETLLRLKGLAPNKNVRVVCGVIHASQVRKALPALPKSNVVVEPQARNTAPAIALATLHVTRVNPQGIILVLPSDQHVADVPAFQASVHEAIRVARDGSIVTLGITPTRPETGYGYIKLGEALSGSARKVAAFVEKPNVQTAEQYMRSGEYLWNAGLFVFRADVMVKAFETHMPEVHTALKTASVPGAESPLRITITGGLAIESRYPAASVVGTVLPPATFNHVRSWPLLFIADAPALKNHEFDGITLNVPPAVPGAGSPSRRTRVLTPVPGVPPGV